MNGSTRKLLLYLVALIVLVAFVVFRGTAPPQEAAQGTQTRGQETLPKADFDHPPKAAFSPDDYFFKLDQLEHFYRVPASSGTGSWARIMGLRRFHSSLPRHNPTVVRIFTCTMSRKHTCCWREAPSTG